MRTLFAAAPLLALAAPALAQVPPVSSNVEPAAPPTVGSPMGGMDRDDGVAPTSADPVDSPVSREGTPAMRPVQRPTPSTRPMPRVMDAPTAPTSTTPPQRPAPRTTPRGQVGTPQPMPQAAAPSTGTGEYPICSKQVTDRCVNPADVRRGIAKRPGR